MGRPFPPWLKKRLPAYPQSTVPAVLEDLRLKTVCSEARCPNRAECFASGTATFLILGNICTRNCRFCAITGGTPGPVDTEEPGRVAQAVARMGLSYVVVTSVTRDDLPDGGAGHFAATVRAVNHKTGASVEVLTPDFKGDAAALDEVLASGPDVFNHNVETVPRLYREVRPVASYERSLEVLRRASARDAKTKSGMMVGFGESRDEVIAVLNDLRNAGVSIVTIGQYLSPDESMLPVREYVHPDVFAAYGEKAEEIGFTGVASSPFVRSSYKAAMLAGLPKPGRM